MSRPRKRGWPALGEMTQTFLSPGRVTTPRPQFQLPSFGVPIPGKKLGLAKAVATIKTVVARLDATVCTHLQRALIDPLEMPVFSMLAITYSVRRFEHR
jgi:hypothetical protein